MTNRIIVQNTFNGERGLLVGWTSQNDITYAIVLKDGNFFEWSKAVVKEYNPVKS